MFKKLTLLFCISLFAISCDSEVGELISKEGLNVYYLAPVTKSEARKVMNFWEKNQFVGEKVQSIQLSISDEKYILKLIPLDTNYLSDIPFEVQLQLFQLDSLLNADLGFEKPIEIFLSDSKFKKTKGL